MRAARRAIGVYRDAGHCQRKNNYLPKRKFGIWPPLISHGFFGSDQSKLHRFKYSEFSSDSALASLWIAGRTELILLTGAGSLRRSLVWGSLIYQALKEK
jgi:hypothetical protein